MKHGKREMNIYDEKVINDTLELIQEEYAWQKDQPSLEESKEVSLKIIRECIKYHIEINMECI